MLFAESLCVNGAINTLHDVTENNAHLPHPSSEWPRITVLMLYDLLNINICRDHLYN